MDEKKLNREQLQESADRAADHGSDEEFAEKIYDENAPTPHQFDNDHDVSYTGIEFDKKSDGPSCER
jgi:hypothetical protein